MYFFVIQFHRNLFRSIDLFCKFGDSYNIMKCFISWNWKMKICQRRQWVAEKACTPGTLQNYHIHSPKLGWKSALLLWLSGEKTNVWKSLPLHFRNPFSETIGQTKKVFQKNVEKCKEKIIWPRRMITTLNMYNSITFYHSF